MNDPTSYQTHSCQQESTDRSTQEWQVSDDLKFVKCIKPIYFKKQQVKAKTYRKSNDSKKIQQTNSRIKQNKKIYQTNSKVKRNGLKISKQKHVSSDYLILGENVYICENLPKITSHWLEASKLIKQNQCSNRQIEISRLNLTQKQELYDLLKEQFGQKDDKIPEEEQTINLIKISVRFIEEKAESYLQQYPHHCQLIKKWKNAKLHQLMTAKTLLLQPLPRIENINEHFVVHLELQLDAILKQNFYPQLKHSFQSLQQELIQHLTIQKYPSQYKSKLCQMRVDTQSHIEDQQNYFGIGGIMATVAIFFQFLQSHEELMMRLIQNMNCLLHKQFNLWSKFALARNRSTESYGEEVVLDDSIYVQFQKSIIGGDDDHQGQKTYLHIFNKLLFDIINVELAKFTPYYPFGQPIPGIQSKISVYLINHESIEAVYQSIMRIIYKQATQLAGIITEQKSIEIDQYNDQKFKEIEKQDLAWLINVDKRVFAILLLSVYLEIQAQIFDFLIKEAIKNIIN